LGLGQEFAPLKGFEPGKNTRVGGLLTNFPKKGHLGLTTISRGLASNFPFIWGPFSLGFFFFGPGGGFRNFQHKGLAEFSNLGFIFGNYLFLGRGWVP